MGTQPRNGFRRVEPRKPSPPVEPKREQITVPEPPTLEQCENMALALGLPILPEGLRPHYYLESMRNLHALAVRMLNGDEDATKALERLTEAFGRA